MTGYMYAAQVGDYLKIGYTWHPGQRVINLRHEYQCNVYLIGIVNGWESIERKFHIANRAFAVGPEIYPADVPSVVEFLKRLAPYSSNRGKCGPRGPLKWTVPYPLGIVPISRQNLRKKLGTPSLSPQQTIEGNAA